MFNSVSWQQYVTIIIIVLIAYYFFMILVYYRKELVRVVRNGFTRQNELFTQTEAVKISPASQPDLESPGVDELLEEIESVLLDAESKKYPKEEMMMALQLKLRKYPSIKGTKFQHPVSNYINAECWSRFNIGLEDTEVDKLW